MLLVHCTAFLDLTPLGSAVMKPVPGTGRSQEAESEELSFFDDDATDILEAANQVQLNDRRDNQQPKADTDFFNRFDDDADESDMRPSA